MSEAVKKAKKSVPAKGKKTLVVVESPAKAKTIEKYLGSKYIVRASMGHLRDLPKSQFGIDVDNDFAPKYINIRGKGDLIKELKKEAQNAGKVYLASDPDREGEAIAWHLSYLLGLDEKEKCRIVFNEITKPAIQKAIKLPQVINADRVDAQQARRMLDRIVGYKLSPLLWRKVRKGLSAGRVQSVTVKLICDREKEIQDFVSEEYWTIEANLRKGKSHQFTAELVMAGSGKPAIGDEKAAKRIVSDIEKQKLTVSAIVKKERQRKAAAPFNTSSLQQDAARKLGFTSRKTMMLAQQLYEGIELGKLGPVGLITSMRTDSVRISELAQNEAKGYIIDNFGKEFAPKKPNVYVSGKKAQDAHEAIRPTSVLITPEETEKYLNRDQQRLYTLVWKRFLASQMTPAVFDTLKVDIAGGKKYLLRANGSQLKFAGFTAVYDGADSKNEKDVILPDMAENDVLDLVKVLPEQHFTEPPPRYNEASLVKTLEEKEIGRPSTYAPIIETIIARGYVMRQDKAFHPTELGFIVVGMLEEHFKDIVDVQFTAGMENDLDEIAEGRIEKNELLRRFYGPFSETLAKADEAIGHVELPVEVSDVVCEKCGRQMVVKQGRFGKFLACPGFPECRNTKPILRDTGGKCPKCGESIVERRTRQGRIFYGCKCYPDCDFVTWDIPLAEPCEKCGSVRLRHHFKSGRGLIYCYNEACETRVNHPINKELERQRKKAAQKAAGAGDTADGTQKPAVRAAKAEKAGAGSRTKAAAKKPATKKTTVKKTAAKTAPKKATVKKTAAKTAAKKTAVKKTAAKAEAKKSTVKKTAVKKPAAKTKAGSKKEKT